MSYAPATHVAEQGSAAAPHLLENDREGVKVGETVDTRPPSALLS